MAPSLPSVLPPRRSSAPGASPPGIAAGDALEEKTYRGLPKDEIYLYEDALAHGRAVLFATPESDGEAEAAHRVLAASGAETLDAARDAFWIGIRDAEKAHYQSASREMPFDAVEGAYRRGYLAGLTGIAAPEGALRSTAEKDGYRCGFERGRQRSKTERIEAGR